MARTYDAIVIGGGVIGASTAFHLAKAGLGRIALVERRTICSGNTRKSGAIVRMHRGELTPEAATDFLVEHTGFELANARAEVRRYTYTPTYQLSYLLGKVLILGLREDERRRRGPDFSLKAFHDALLRNGSLPISFHRRLLRGGRRQDEDRRCRDARHADAL